MKQSAFPAGMQPKMDVTEIVLSGKSSGLFIWAECLADKIMLDYRHKFPEMNVSGVVFDVYTSLKGRERLIKRHRLVVLRTVPQ